MEGKRIWESENFYLEHHESEIPWLILHPRKSYKEMSEIPETMRYEICDLLCLIEKEMIGYYRPEKINIASFGNYLPRVHWHIMARFSDDSRFPEPMWGKRQREGRLSLPPADPFFRRLKNLLDRRHSETGS